MLMAAALLISTNMWAQFQIGSQSYTSLQAAIDAAPAGATTEIDMNVALFNANTSVWLGTANVNDPAKHIILDLNGGTYQYTGSNKLAFAVSHGTLEIKSTGNEGLVQSSTTTIDDLIRVYGTYQEIDASGENPTTFAYLIIRENVEVKNVKKNVLTVDVMRPGQPALFGKADPDIKYACDVFYNSSISGTSGFGLANGARIDVYGTVTSEKKYGIKVNGCVRFVGDYTTTGTTTFKTGYPYLRNDYAPKWNGTDNTGSYAITSAAGQYSPYVYIAPTGYVTTASDEKGAVAAYSSGFARWLVKGYCGGSTGLYVKSGQVILQDATITSTNDNHEQPKGKGSGVEAGGSAIVIETNSNYSGNISVTITGNTEVSATSGYAIEETITANNGQGDTEVETITIEGGTISGGSEGAIVIEDKTKNEVTVTGGGVSGPVTIGNTTYTNLDNAVTGQPSLIDPEEVKTVPVVLDDKIVIVVVPKTTPDSYIVTLNDNMLATFSAVEATKIEPGSDLEAYQAVEKNGEALVLSKITDGIIPAATGVILYNGTSNTKNFQLTVTTETSGTYFADNMLHPAVAWLSSYSGGAYVLVGNEMYLYTGLKMKANKAFLTLPAADPNFAPKRIQLVFDETQAVDNVETTIEAVKFMENGQLFIRRGENIYNVQGQIVK